AQYPTIGDLDSTRRVEQVCDFFAACLLMPRAWVKHACCDDRIQTPLALARRFVVSQAAMHRRLLALGLIDRRSRCLVSTHI
ncbi:MAG: ImmA/IrrE family metallo-endopeptidase, partial [Acidimicrobiales bacterium]